MKTAVISIGVDRVAGMPTLQGCAEGAIEFSAWAETMGHFVHCFNDADGNIVKIQPIKEVIRKIVLERTYSKVIIFFSGHGIIVTPGSELWLLSNALSDSDEAIDLVHSSIHSRNSRIPHLIFISDACRSPSAQIRLSQLRGGIIFPNETALGKMPAIDFFYATLPGMPAYEVITNSTEGRFDGIFTRCLLMGLQGAAPNIISREETQPYRKVIRSQGLKTFILNSLPNLLADSSATIQQEPDIRVESHNPLFFSEVTESLHGETLGGKNANIPNHSPQIQSDLIANLIFDTTKPKLEEGSETLNKAKKAIEEFRDYFEDLNFTKDDPLRFIVTGIKVKRVAVFGATSHEIKSNGRAYEIWFNLDRVKSTSMVIQFENDTGLVVPAIDGYSGAIQFKGGRLVYLGYTTHTAINSNYRSTLNRLKANFTVAANFGVLRIGTPQLEQNSQLIKDICAFDPIISLYILYSIFELEGAIGASKAMGIIGEYHTALKFDASLMGVACNHLGPPIPLLQRGWSYIEKSKLPKYSKQKKILDLGEFLIPSNWSYFSKDGIELLIEECLRTAPSSEASECSH